MKNNIGIIRNLQQTHKTPLNSTNSDCYEQQMQRRVRLLRPSWKIKPRATSVIHNGRDLYYQTQNSGNTLGDRMAGRNDKLFTNTNIRAYLSTPIKRIMHNYTGINFMVQNKSIERKADKKFISLEEISKSSKESMEVSIINISSLLRRPFNSPEQTNQLKELLLPLNKPKDIVKNLLHNINIRFKSNTQLRQSKNSLYLKCRRAFNNYVRISKPITNLQVSSVLKGISLYLHNKGRDSTSARRCKYSKNLAKKTNEAELPKYEFRVNIKPRKIRYSINKESYNFKF